MAPFDVLPEVRKAVGPDVEVIMDGGVRRGIDVVKALARGADSVACGRAYLCGLAAGGFEGVDKALTLLSKDVHLAMGLLGCRTVAELKARGPEFMLHKQGSSFVYDNGTGCANPASARRRRTYARIYPPPPLVNLLGSAGEFVRLLSARLPCARGSVAFLPAASRIARSRSLSGASGGGRRRDRERARRPRAGSRSAPPTRRRAPDRSSPSPRPDT